MTTPEPPTTSRAPLIGAGIVIVLVLAIAFGSWLVRDDEMYTGLEPSDTPSATTTDGTDGTVELALPAQESARCMPVDAETLGRAETAFDGEVLSVEDDAVTLAVREWYAGGGDAAQVRLDLAQVPSSLAGSFDFQQSKRYLVAANDDTVMVCGFSAPWSADLERTYTDAFAG